MGQQSSERAERIEAQEPPRAPRLLEAGTEEIQCVHVRHEVPEAPVHEHESQYRPPPPLESVQREAERFLESSEDPDELQVVDGDVGCYERLHPHHEAGVAVAFRSL